MEFELFVGRMAWCWWCCWDWIHLPSDCVVAVVVAADVVADVVDSSLFVHEVAGHVPLKGGYLQIMDVMRMAIDHNID